MEFDNWFYVTGERKKEEVRGNCLTGDKAEYKTRVTKNVLVKNKRK